jgi:hypothetical protein
MSLNRRKNIYYWKSDRPDVKGNVQSLEPCKYPELEETVRCYLIDNFKKDLIDLRPANGQGNHITFLALYPDRTFFIRVENGFEKDDYMDVETAVLRQVNAIGIPSPRVFHSDGSRHKVPFAIQVIEYIESKDLNILDKKGELEINVVAKSIGNYIAQWQDITPLKFGLFDPSILVNEKVLEGYHNTYRDYFLLNWDKHLEYLEHALFLMQSRCLK